MLKFEKIEPSQSAEACVILLHGLGASGHDLMNIIPMLPLPKHLPIRFIFPHAPLKAVTINNGVRMPAWYDIHGFSHDAREDLIGLEHSRLLLDELLQSQISAGISPEKILLGGFSQGAALTLFTGLQSPYPLAGLIALSGYLPSANHLLQHIKPQAKATPIFIANGTEDPIVQYAWGETAKNCLIEKGFKIEWHAYPMAHEICLPEIQHIATFMTKAFDGKFSAT